MGEESFQEVLEELKSRNTSKSDITIEPVENALEELGRPDRQYEVVLVGGTNGKGSTVEMISELLQSQGKKVGISKSPHLTTVRERIQLNGEMISREKFLELYNRLRTLDQELSFFEFVTVMAYLYFAEESVDYAVMEVGMGGKLDATNAADPELSVITNIQRDHTDFLGDTRKEIAREKAGIVPESGKLVTETKLDPVIQKASQRDTEILEPEEIEEKDGKYVLEREKFTIPVDGSFQRKNLEKAFTAVKGLEEAPEDLEYALSGLECPGRMEVISEEPKVLVDGAHNTDAIAKILEDLPKGFTCVFNATETKEIGKMVEKLEEKASRFVLTESDVEWSKKPEIISEKCSKPVEIRKDPGEAVKRADQFEDPVVVTGSLYLIGSLKQKMNGED